MLAKDSAKAAHERDSEASGVFLGERVQRITEKGESSVEIGAGKKTSSSTGSSGSLMATASLSNFHSKGRKAGRIDTSLATFQRSCFIQPRR